MSGDHTTAGIAMYGAIVATLDLIWNVYKWWTDRSKLTVRCMVGRAVANGVYVPIDSSKSDSPAALIYRVTNIGTRPATVRLLGGTHIKWRGWTPKRRVFVSPDKMPATLEPSGEVVAKYCQFLTLGRITTLEAVDSTDRHYKAPRKDLRKVRRAISQLRRQGRRVALGTTSGTKCD